MKHRAAAYSLAAALCLALYWPGLVAWFSMDDFAWLGLRREINTFAELLGALFAPKAQGTVRPLSERGYFLALEWVFGLEALPFRMVAFGVQLLNVWMAMRLVERMTGSRAAGLAAAILWIANSSLAKAMAWSSAFNQILWPCFLLAACHARWRWLTEGNRRARWAEWAFFLLGFGALELQVTYPAIAAAMTLLYKRDRWRDLPPLFAVSALYAGFNRWMAPGQTSAIYTLHWDGSILATFGQYLRMAMGMWMPQRLVRFEGWWVAAECVAGLGLIAALVWLAWRRERLAVFGLVWFMATLAPILPLRDHVTPYYLTVPVLGLAMAAGFAVARRPAWAALPVLVYLAGSGYIARRAVEYDYRRAEQSRVLFAGVQEAHRLHPGKIILLSAVSSDLYWGLINDDPFRLVDGLRVFMAPGSEKSIEPNPEFGDPLRFVLPGPTAVASLAAGEAVVYAPAGEKLRNVTELWRGLAPQQWKASLAQIVDAGQPMAANQLGEGWHPLETGFRWSMGHARVRLGAPEQASELWVAAIRGPASLDTREGLTLVARLNGIEVHRWVLRSGEAALSGTARLPAGIDRTKPAEVELTITPVLREEGVGGRELGLAFGKIGFR